MLPTTVGIDPGLSGAVAILSDAGERVVDMPVAPWSKKGFVKNAVDLAGVAGLLRPIAGGVRVVAIERLTARPMQGVGSMFSLGMSMYGVAGVCAGLGLTVRWVEPKEWKGFFGLGPDKEEARVKAVGMFPFTPLSRMRDHNRAEALLIARWAQEAK